MAFIFEEIVKHTMVWGERANIACKIVKCDFIIYAPTHAQQKILDEERYENRTNALTQFKEAVEWLKTKHESVLFPIIMDAEAAEYQGLGALLNTHPKFAERTSIISMLMPSEDKIRSFPLDLTSKEYMGPNSFKAEYIMMWVRYFSLNKDIMQFIVDKSELQKSSMPEAVKVEKEKDINLAAKSRMDETKIIMSMLAGHQLLVEMVKENEAEVEALDLPEPTEAIIPIEYEQKPTEE
jgi:hypothetical protein